MKAPIAVFALLSQSLFAADSPAPNLLRASIGTPFTGTATIVLTGDTITYTLENHKGTETATLKPTEKQWQDFRATIEEINIWRWRSLYKPHPNGGEAMWSLDIEFPKRRLHTSGIAVWPDSKGSPQPQPTPEFLRLQKAIEKLAGGRKLL